MLLALVGGTVALAQWHQVRSKRYEDRVQQIIDQKPVVFTDSLRDGSYEIRNLGSAYAFNVWLVVAAHEEPIALGSLDTHQARILPVTVALILDRAEARAHILLAAARPVPLPPSERRPYTVTFNAQGTDGMFRHEYDRDPPKTRLVRDGTIQEYLGVEREDLLAKLAAFVAESEMAS